ncbi:hypothetical protein [Azospirillum himalayense]|uniref:hypothetical protein n=1 Tax=Azospirillum himalayense TaxID=654847 RepID=UPI003671FC4F
MPMQPMAMIPLYWTNAARRPKKLSAENTPGSAASHKIVRRVKIPHKDSLILVMATSSVSATVEVRMEECFAIAFPVTSRFRSSQPFESSATTTAGRAANPVTCESRPWFP